MREQNAGADQINQAIRQLDSVIQSNAASATEAASVSEELAAQSEALHAAIGFFDIGNGADATGSGNIPRKGKRGSAGAKPARVTSNVAHLKPRASDAGGGAAAHVAGKRNGTNGVMLDLGPETVSDQDFERY
jgi:methyl-accepting chemotaxis protein